MRWMAFGLAAVGVAIAASTSFGGASISSTDGVNTVYLGVNNEGHLNTTDGTHSANGTGGALGMAYSNATTGGIRDATSPGCLCEGWGVSASGVSGYANVSSDPGAAAATLVVDSFTSTASTITSAVHLTSTPGISVTQAYTVDVAGSLFKDTVTIKNTTGATVTNVKYVRVMDWDVPFTEFSEFVSIVGATANLIPAPGGKLEFSNDQGFASANPLAGNPGAILGGTTNTDFIDSGPADHGAYFRFNFGSLANGASVTFAIYYGAAPSEAAMLTSLSLASSPINLYSFGQSSPPSGNPTLGTPITYAFGFSGIGDVVVVPSAGVPETASLGIWGGLLCLAGLVFWRRQKRALVIA